MVTRTDLNASFDKLSETVLKVKRDRDALLAVARHAHIYLVQSDDPDKRELADELWAAIKESEKP